MLEQPWGKIQYEIIFAQLAHLKNKKILDFGSGLGLVSKFLSENNEVVAIEPEKEMLFAYSNHTYEKILGSLEQVEEFESESFDIVLCHNVLEYIEENNREKYLSEFKRVLKRDGKLSIIKHNQVGKIMQAVVFSNDVDQALDLLKGNEFRSVSFNSGSTYTIDKLLEMSKMKLDKYQAIRTFYSLQMNEVKTQDKWIEKMTEMELSVCDLYPYKDISFLQHVWLMKE
ncbi:class I SAM-dependent methyltransferase [Granulicatella elegans]|uniref:class I SAM-dependent methyltransferase n=1 Tax=Granulicatella elegans TaxID=137732 RepID=UPI001D13ECCB|nr:class I SAM-dependent methyltransferase [Granulicatella elegans]UEA32290.1 methyltransferase domain-containing protein [Granulicatella elegans]